MALQIITDQTFQKEVLEEKGRYVLVDFWAEWCGPCKMLAPVLAKLSERFLDQVKMGKLDVDQNPGIAQKFMITSIPCNILFKDGKEVERIVGHRSESAFADELQKIISKN